MAKGFKQASNSLDEKASKESEHIGEKTDKPKVTASPKVTEPAGSSGGVKFGKGFSTADDTYKKDKSDYDTKPDYINPIKVTEKVNYESVKNPSTYYDEPLPKSKKKSHKGLIIGIAAAMVVCAVIGGKAISQLSNNNKSNISTVGTEYSSSNNSSTTASTEYSSSDNSSTTANSNNYVKTKDESDNVFSTFSNYAHTYETQQISLIGMTSEEKSNYDTSSIHIPSEMVGEDKKMVGSINPSGTTFEWSRNHNSDVSQVQIGKTQITVKYGEQNSTLKSYLSEFSSLYSDISKSYVAHYDSSKYKADSSSKKEETLSFKEMCQQSFQHIGEVLGKEEIGKGIGGNIHYTSPDTFGSSIDEKFYYNDTVCAREIFVVTPIRDSITIYMMKAVNCGNNVRTMYCKYYYETSSCEINSAMDLYENDLRDLYEIEQTMIDF